MTEVMYLDVSPDTMFTLLAAGYTSTHEDVTEEELTGLYRAIVDKTDEGDKGLRASVAVQVACFDAALEVMKAQGATIVEIPGTLFENLQREGQVIEAYDFGPDLEAYLKNAPPAVKTRTLKDLIAGNRHPMDTFTLHRLARQYDSLYVVSSSG